MAKTIYGQELTQITDPLELEKIAQMNVAAGFGGLTKEGNKYTYTSGQKSTTPGEAFSYSLPEKSLTISTNNSELNKSLSNDATDLKNQITGLSFNRETREAELVTKEAERKRLEQEQIGEQYKPLFEETEEQRAGAISQTAGARGALPQSMGFSSAEQGIINMVNKRYDDRKVELERQMNLAKRNLDLDSIKRVQEQVDKEEASYTTKMDTLWDRFFKTQTLRQGEEKMAFEEKKFATDTKMEKAKLDASLEKESKKTTRELMVEYGDAGIADTDDAETIKQKLANSEIYKKKIAEEYKTISETANGRNWLITLDSKGNVIKKVDLGSAYKGTGGGTITTNFAKLQSETQREIDNIVGGQSSFTESFKRLKQYADRVGIKVSNEDLNILLGGEIPYNYQTEQWTPEKATGLANEQEVEKRQQEKFKQTTKSSLDSLIKLHGKILEETDKYYRFADNYIEYK